MIYRLVSKPWHKFITSKWKIRLLSTTTALSAEMNKELLMGMIKIMMKEFKVILQRIEWYLHILSPFTITTFKQTTSIQNPGKACSSNSNEIIKKRKHNKKDATLCFALARGLKKHPS
jgi:hypothetical protein